MNPRSLRSLSHPRLPLGTSFVFNKAISYRSFAHKHELSDFKPAKGPNFRSRSVVRLRTSKSIDQVSEIRTKRVSLGGRLRMMQVVTLTPPVGAVPDKHTREPGFSLSTVKRSVAKRVRQLRLKLELHREDLTKRRNGEGKKVERRRESSVFLFQNEGIREKWME